MATKSFRYILAGLFGGLIVGALMMQVARSGILQDSGILQGSAPDPDECEEIELAIPPKESEDDKGYNDEFEQPLLQKLSDAVDAIDDDDADDAELDRDDMRERLLEADDILTRIKKQNAEGLRRANSPPRRICPPPRRPKIIVPEEEEEEEDTEDAVEEAVDAMDTVEEAVETIADEPPAVE